MGATISTPESPQSGVITVTNYAASPQSPKLTDPLLQQLQQLKEALPVLISEKDAVWSDLNAAKALESGQAITAADVEKFLQIYQEWEKTWTKQISDKQDAIHHKLDHVEQVCTDTVKHVRRAADDMELLSKQLAVDLQAKLQVLTTQSQSPRRAIP